MHLSSVFRFVFANHSALNGAANCGGDFVLGQVQRDVRQATRCLGSKTSSLAQLATISRLKAHTRTHINALRSSAKSIRVARGRQVNCTQVSRRRRRRLARHSSSSSSSCHLAFAKLFRCRTADNVVDENRVRSISLCASLRTLICPRESLCEFAQFSVGLVVEFKAAATGVCSSSRGQVIRGNTSSGD